MSGHADSLKTVLFALGANFGIAITKAAAAVLTGSGSMLAEAIHSFADCGNQLLLLLGMRQAKAAPTPDFPLGQGKAKYFWSFIVALMLFSVGGLFSIYEGWHKLHAPEPIGRPWIAIGVLLMSIGLETVSLRACLAEIAKVRAGRSLWTWFKETRQSELVVILGEDLAAEAGLTLALGFILLSLLTGNPAFDAMGSIAIGALLVMVGIGIGIQVKGLIIGESAERNVREAMETFLAAVPGIHKVLNVITLHFGDHVMVAVKAHMTETGSAEALCGRINEIEAAFKREFPQVKWVFFEPDMVA